MSVLPAKLSPGGGQGFRTGKETDVFAVSSKFPALEVVILFMSTRGQQQHSNPPSWAQQSGLGDLSL